MKIVRNVFFFGVLILLLENLILAFDNLQNKWPIFGLMVSNRPLVLIHEGGQFTITRKNLGIDYGQVLIIGRTGSLWQRLKDQNLAAFGLMKISPRMSSGLLALSVLEIQDKVDVPAITAMPNFTGNLDSVVPAKNGILVDTKKLVEIISQNIFDPPFFPITVPIKEDLAVDDGSQLNDIRSQVKGIIKSPISISSAGKAFTLNYEDILKLLTLAKRQDPINPKKQTVSLRLDDSKLNNLLDSFAKEVEGITNAEFDYHDARVAIYAQFYSNVHKTLAIPTGMATRNVLAAETQSSGPKTIYLTFDDGPNSIYQPIILDILKAYGIKATFFLIGNNVVNSKDVALRTFNEGNEIGNHSLTHPFLPNLTASQIYSELSKTNQILQPINGNSTITLFRPPYGGVNSNVRLDAAKLGMKLYLWTVDPRDWSEPSTDELVRRVVSATTNGSDILLHSNHLVTVKALPKIIETLKGEGYSFALLQR